MSLVYLLRLTNERGVFVFSYRFKSMYVNIMYLIHNIYLTLFLQKVQINANVENDLHVN